MNVTLVEKRYLEIGNSNVIWEHGKYQILNAYIYKGGAIKLKLSQIDLTLKPKEIKLNNDKSKQHFLQLLGLNYNDDIEVLKQYLPSYEYSIFDFARQAKPYIEANQEYLKGYYHNSLFPKDAIIFFCPNKNNPFLQDFISIISPNLELEIKENNQYFDFTVWEIPLWEILMEHVWKERGY